jgi:hypothetical protein
MPSPFPGMDPYIEARHLFEDFHLHLIDDIYRALSDILPDRYVVRTGERSYVALVQVDDEPDKRDFLPDVTVASTRGSTRRRRKPKGSAGTSALQTPPGAVLMRPMVTAEYRETFLEIRQVDPDHKLVTGIEVLSPSNKDYGSKGWWLYYRKRRAFLAGYANLVELDLLRGGRRMPMSSPWPESPYYLLTRYKKPRRKCFAWPAYSIKPLPPITIPLNPPDPDISLELQPLVDAIYARSRYAYDIDYRRPLTPPLSPAEQAWLEERLREQQTKT